MKTEKTGRAGKALRRGAAIMMAAAGLSTAMIMICAMASASQPVGATDADPVCVVAMSATGQGAVTASPHVSVFDVRQASELLVEAIVQVESAGDPRCVGRAGERGLMQIKLETWREVSTRLEGRAIPFGEAFHPDTNRRVGRAYLRELQAFLRSNRERWRGDERALLLACYNAGPWRVQAAGFDVRHLPSATRDYVERASALHDLYLAEHAATLRALLLADSHGGVAAPRDS